MVSNLPNSLERVFISTQITFLMNLQDSISTIMTTPVTCIDSHQLLVDLKHIYEKVHFHHHVPVLTDGKLVGVVSLVDFMREVHHAGLDDNEGVYQHMKVSDIMSVHPVHVNEKATIEDVAKLLSTGQINSVIITNKNKVSGIVTTIDLVKLLFKKD